MRRKVCLMVPALTVVCLGAVFGIVWVVSDGAASPPAPEKPVSCGTCHSMAKEVQAWQQGPHGDLACLQCHAENDPSWVRHEYAELTPEMAKASPEAGSHTVAMQVPDQRCETCHEPQMQQIRQDITPAPLRAASAVSGNAGRPMVIIAAHDLHVSGQAGMKCVDCHTVHGARAGTPEYRDSYHDRCQDCHDQQHVTIAVAGSVSCAACHREPASVAPQTHQSETQWQREHGKAGRGQTCGQCHLADSAGPHSKLSSPEAFPSTTQDACAACHAGLAMPHQPDFLALHGEQFLSAPAGTCETCHAPDKTLITPVPAHATARFCTDCHAQPMPHPESFAITHGPLALKSPGTCTVCHSSQNQARPAAPHASAGFCASCHDSYRHPANWIGTHGQQAQTATGGTCEACHAPNGNRDQPAPHATARFCTDCHAGVAMPHPPGYLKVHGRQAVSAPQGTCDACHSQAKNPVKPTPDHASAQFCTSCHVQPMPHPASFRPAHGKEALQAPATCETCHSARNPANATAPHASPTFCAGCHDAYQHPAGWVGTHGARVTEACATCHTVEMQQGQPGQHNACSACHTGSSAWHPQMWFISHGQVVSTQGQEGCMKCHEAVEPSCSQCHRSR